MKVSVISTGDTITGIASSTPAKPRLWFLAFVHN